MTDGRIAASYGLQALAEIIDNDPMAEVVKMQPPDGMVVRFINGDVYCISMHRTGK